MSEVEKLITGWSPEMHALCGTHMRREFGNWQPPKKLERTRTAKPATQREKALSRARSGVNRPRKRTVVVER